jgi:heme/copper-type cytochrome/quinol oxidase subunit 2
MIASFGDALFWVAVALCVIAQVALLHSFFLGASRPARDTAASFRATETVWALAPAAVLGLLLVATWREMHAPASFRFQIAPAEAPALPAAPATVPGVAR